ncbi:MAG: hypothetical protein GFH27_549347n24 [Chloroflexi bacterium AL-W]|nr:hypothetical protein [Chloroflexi bacterium AL-N1]NOK70806.1 hypothetical protein [Chloroflexi bacterium AL-N10]NOK78366.1 hypothetical protein [Chloroflexi bacterium AL-N5]NOK85347.1 hypothetical protein [Chloroflexi bacterium AL-W]NOK92623.1 hypothetical protein [Chloroflexi bacterium AL-N15]
MDHSQPRRLEERLARELGLALLLLGVALVQTALLPRPLGFTPNVLLMLVLSQALIAGAANAARWAFYGGISLDLCAGTLLGSHSLLLLAAVLVGTLPFVRLRRDNWFLPLGSALLGALTYYVLFPLVTGGLALLSNQTLLQTHMLIIVLPGVLIVLIPALPLFTFMRWLESRRRGEVPVDIY